MRKLWKGLGFVLLFMLLAAMFAAIEPGLTAALARIELRQQQQVQHGRILHAYRAHAAVANVGATILARVPSATQLRVAIIHRAEANVPLRYDVTLVLGAGTNATFNDVPLSQWQSFLDDFLIHRCAAATLTDAGLSPDDRVHLLGMKAMAEAACALTDAQGRLLGALLLTWDSAPASPAEMDAALATLRSGAIAIGHLVPEL